MLNRPFFNARIDALERQFDENREDRGFLETLVAELRHRGNRRADDLRRRAVQALSVLPAGTKTASAREKPSLERSKQAQPTPAEPSKKPGPPVADVLPETESDRADVAGPTAWPGKRHSGTEAVSENADQLGRNTSAGEEAAWDAALEMPAEPPAWDDQAWASGDDASPPPTASPRARRFTNRPVAILDAWTALEVLSPQTFGRPEDLADGDRRRVARFDERPLPWQQPDKARPKTRLYYHVVLGAVRMDRAEQSLLKAFRDGRVERPASRKLAALAVVTVDRAGKPTDDGSIAVSSFGWGFGRVRAGAITQLGTWTTVEREIVSGLTKRLVVENEDEEVEPLTLERIDATHRWLAQAFGIPNDHLEPPFFAVRAYQWAALKDAPDPLLLNSFYLRDLGRARVLVEAGKVGPALRRYLGADVPAERADLFRDRRALETLLKPKNMPPARWPSGGHSLVLLQQAAVNMTQTELTESGIAAVNGPPGTGKTTLLRDVLASVVLDRARAMARFDDPEAAFKHRTKVKRGSGFVHLYELHSTLRGHELLVASSNNKAVENVSRELPDARNIAQDPAPPRYFTTVADTLAGTEGASWGLVAAVLGNAAKRSKFYKAFWHDDDTGLRSYLWAASGGKPMATRVDPNTGQAVGATPRVVEYEHPPRDHEDALVRWKKARTRFRKALQAAEAALGELDAGREAEVLLKPLREAAETTRSRVETAAIDQQRLAAESERQRGELVTAEARLFEKESALSGWDAEWSGWLAGLLRTRSYQEWRTRRGLLEEAAAEAKRTVETARALVAQHVGAVRGAEARTRAALAERDQAATTLAAVEQATIVARRSAGERFVDATFWDRERGPLQTSTPWASAELQRARDVVFTAAFDLHRAFVDAAAKPIRNNLGVLMGVLIGQRLDDQKAMLLPSLWSTLFLVTPVISTTFASVDRMLGPLPPESLGWLLIDEAGQALPQAAVGAIARTKRAFVVGDPLQLEPVVSLPLALVDEVAAAFEVDPETWAAPRASAQTRADDASRYFADIERKDGHVRVGAPLVVHRRCAEPMFSISNRISYGDAMVRATIERASAIKETLGPSRWINVEGRSEEKWCPEEGEIVVDLLRRLAQVGVGRPDLFVITPFVVVAQRMRERLRREAGLLERIALDPKTWTYERVGTVYTAQGKEAEAVVLLLGAPDPQQVGARVWAGRPANQVNVAVSRAKQALYVVGNRRHWQTAGCFAELSARLP